MRVYSSDNACSTLSQACEIDVVCVLFCFVWPRSRSVMPKSICKGKDEKFRCSVIMRYKRAGECETRRDETRYQSQAREKPITKTSLMSWYTTKKNWNYDGTKLSLHVDTR